MTYIITDPCRSVCDTSCVEVCPVDCIYPAENHSFETEEGKEKMREANEMLYIHPEECIDCGACEPECPVEAIYPDEEVPEDQKDYIGVNYRRFGMEPPEEDL